MAVRKGKAKKKRIDLSEPTAPEVESTSPPEDMTIKEMQEQEVVEATKMDFCPVCGQFAQQGALQPQMPMHGPQGQTIGIPLPMLVCLRCGDVYMPRSFINQIMSQQRTNIITP